MTAITSFAGIVNLANVHEMQYAFSSCSGVASLVPIMVAMRD